MTTKHKHRRRSRSRLHLGRPVCPRPAAPAPPVILSALPPHRGNQEEAAAARLIGWTLSEPHPPARRVAAQSAAEALENQKIRRVLDRLSDLQARQIVMMGLRSAYRRQPTMLGRIWNVLVKFLTF